MTERELMDAHHLHRRDCGEEIAGVARRYRSQIRITRFQSMSHCPWSHKLRGVAFGGNGNCAWISGRREWSSCWVIGHLGQFM